MFKHLIILLLWKDLLIGFEPTNPVISQVGLFAQNPDGNVN